MNQSNQAETVPMAVLPPFFVPEFRDATWISAHLRAPIFFDKGRGKMTVFSVFLREKTW